jgi:hypothetical protein
VAKERMPDDRGRTLDPPSRLQITVTGVPAGRAHRFRPTRGALRGAPRAMSVLLGLVAVGLAALVAGALPTGATRAGRPSAAAARGAVTAPVARRAVTAAVAAAFGYPHRCLSITVSPADPDYASAHVDRRGGCADYHGYINASFDRIDGKWRLVLDEGQLFVPNSLLTPSASDSAEPGRGPSSRRRAVR